MKEMFISVQSGVTFVIESGETKVGINQTIPGYSLQIGTGDLYVTQGNVGINASPDPQHRLRITTEDSDGTNMTGLRVDLSHQTTGSGLTGIFNGIQVRNTSPRSMTGASLTYGINSNLTPSVSSGVHTYVAGRFRAASTQSGTGTSVNYALQLQDGTEGTAGHVWTSVDTVGNGHWVSPSSLFGNVTASNGLTKSGDNITLGGALTGDTYINNSGFLLRADEFSATTMSAQTTYLTSTSVAQLIMEPVNASAPADGSMWFTTSGGTTFLNYQVTGSTKSVELT